jgi:hypothetical protein
MPVSFYPRSKDVALFAGNPVILLPPVEGCEPKVGGRRKGDG